MFCLEIHRFWVQPGTMYFPFFSKCSAFKKCKVSSGYLLTQPGVSFSMVIRGRKGEGFWFWVLLNALRKGKKSQ